MSATQVAPPPAAVGVPEPVLVVLRGVGQVFFQEHALTGLLITLGIAAGVPLIALGGVVGSAVGAAVARGLKFDAGEVRAGIYGFNSALVGMASFFFFQPDAVSVGLMLAGSAAAAAVTRGMRGYLPFPTYTAPFIVTTWAVYFLGRALGAVASDPSAPALLPNPALPFAVESTAHGIGQVMFQASLWTGVLFLAGIAVSNREHAAWVLVGSLVGMLVAGYHVDAAVRSLDPERLVERDHWEIIRLGLFGYNATLAAVALFLWRRSVIAPALGMILSVPITESFPRVGLPALTAPFVLATWAVLALGWVEARLLGKNRTAVP
ncbi:MAG: urea transporter [Gemmataceae bacterium]|nr:urea transporter [Gemmataceae bacterium]